MSIATEIARIQSDRNTIRAKLIELGIAASVDNLDKLAEAVADIVNRGAVSLTVKEGETVTIPAGYHNGSGTVSGVSGGGNYNLQSKTATPTKKQQNITPDSGYYGLSDVTVAAIPDNYQDVSGVSAVSDDVLTGKVIVLPDGSLVAGTMPNNGRTNGLLTVDNPSFTIPKGYHNGEGRVYITPQPMIVIPSKEANTVTATSGKVLSSVTVEAIPDKYQDVSGVTATPNAVLNGYQFVDSAGEVLEGNVPIYGTDYNIDGLSQTVFEIPYGYHDGSFVHLTDDIEKALAAI